MTPEKFNLQIQTPETGDNDEISKLKAELMSYKPLIEDAVKRQNLKDAEELFAKAKELKERLTELREQRKIQSDPNYTPELDKFKPEQIANGIDKISEKTIIYIGEWNPAVFRKIKNFSNIKYLYESFPDKKIFTFELKTDATIQTPEQAESKIKEKGMFLGDYAKDILYKTEFNTESQEYSLVSFSVEQLGFPNGAKLKDIYTKAKELGLELCPAEVGPQLRLQYENQPESEYLRIAMKAIPDRDGDLTLVSVGRSSGRLWLHDHSGRPGLEWLSNDRFVFLSRKS